MAGVDDGILIPAETLRRWSRQVFERVINKIIETYLSLARQIRWATSTSLCAQDRPAQSYEEHKEILAAFQRKEAEKVRMLIESHSNRVMNRILSQMESHKPEPAL